MAYRATDDSVRAVIQTNPSIDTTPFISAANSMVNRLVTLDKASLLTTTFNGEGIDQATQVETWLAAHYYQLRDPAYQTKTTGKASATFQGRTAQGLNSSFWGQQAMLLDITGNLARLDYEAQHGGRPVVQIHHVGGEYSHDRQQFPNDPCWNDNV